MNDERNQSGRRVQHWHQTDRQTRRQTVRLGRLWIPGAAASVRSAAVSFQKSQMKQPSSTFRFNGLPPEATPIAIAPHLSTTSLQGRHRPHRPPSNTKPHSLKPWRTIFIHVFHSCVASTVFHLCHSPLLFHPYSSSISSSRPGGTEWIEWDSSGMILALHGRFSVIT